MPRNLHIYVCVCREDYPDVTVFASVHPLSPTKEFLATLCTGAQMGFIALTLLGRHAVDSLRLGTIVPANILDALEQNKFQNVMAAWFIGNFVQQVRSKKPFASSRSLARSDS